MKTRTINIGYLARVEGETSLYIEMNDNRVTDAQLQIFEPPRFFEAFLQGRRFSEAPDITARICGICPVAYQMSATHAMENACGVAITGPIRELRRLLYCGEWIESHALHIFMLHAPDFLGYPDVIQMAQDHPDLVKQALEMKKAGNAIVTLLGGREIHPINVRVGGFYRTPKKHEFAELAEQLKRARDMAVGAVQWLGQLAFPEFEREYEYVALRHPDEYPMNEGRIVSNTGLDIAVQEYEQHFVEEHVAYTHALHSKHIGMGAYFVGPLARYNLNFDRLSPIAQDAARNAGLENNCMNPFKSIIVRGVEMLYAMDEALRVIEAYEEPDRPYVDIPLRASTGYACTEAPRGILYHRYAINESGEILEAKITPPTAQNQKIIEQDLRHFAEQYIDESDDVLTAHCEQAIRNYDPCISCATHFLQVHVKRS